MPIKSLSQARLMYAAKNNPEVAKRTGVSKEVAEDFIKATPKGSFKKLKEKVSKKK